MPCYEPLTAYRHADPSKVTKKGKRKLTFNRSKGFVDAPIKLPCGQCIGCKLERSRQWAIRCAHEAQLYQNNCFITLTYRDDDLPEGGTLVPRDWTLFLKKLRKQFQGLEPVLRVVKGVEKTTFPIRFFACGEYGEKKLRPHYHACLFNFDFPDKRLHKVERDQSLYTSESLDKIWGNGFAVIGSVTFESAAYVARYITKKITGEQANGEYERFNIETGEIHTVEPEFVRMSRRPGLAADWYKRYRGDVYPSDSIVLRGRGKMRPPKYYDTLLEREDEAAFGAIKRGRVRQAMKHADNNTPDRLKVRREIQEIKYGRLVRGLEQEL